MLSVCESVSPSVRESVILWDIEELTLLKMGYFITNIYSQIVPLCTDFVLASRGPLVI